MTTRRLLSHYRGCLLGGAIGDALGSAIEFDPLAAIRRRFGPAGLTGYAEQYGRKGAITDDTQMTLFTAEGLLWAHNRLCERGICSIVDVVRLAYLRWLHTQGGGPVERQFLDGWLVQERGLHSRRAPGNTCLSALRAGGRGSPEQPINDSKGCGGVMRMAPVGLIDVEDPFRLGCELVALTHGHSSGFLAAGAFAAIVH